jgi:hypothetical protein
MREQFYTGDADCTWLLDTALRGYTVPVFRSFLLDGNEDCPLRIRCYGSPQPRYNARPVYDVTLVTGHDNLGTYQRTEAI